MRLLSFLTRLHWWIRWLWWSLIFVIPTSIAGTLIFEYATTGSVTLDPAFSSFLMEYAPILGSAVLVLVLLTGVTWWSKVRKRAYDSFRTLKRGRNLTSPNEIAYAPVYTDETFENSTAGRYLRQRPYKNTYVPLPLIQWEEAKQKGIGEADTYTDTDIANHLTEGEHVLIVGAPTSGKTRKAFEILREDLSARYVVVPKQEALGDGLPQGALQFLSGEEVTIVLDDLDKYASDGDALRKYIQTIEQAAASCSILGTCRDGPELQRARDRRDGRPLLSSGIKEVHKLFSGHRYLVVPPTAEQYRKIAQGAGLDLSTLNLDEYGTPGDLLLGESKREMRDRFENDLSPNEKDLLHAAQLLDEANVGVTHQRLRWTFQEIFGRSAPGSKAALEDMLVRLGRLGFIASPWKRDPVALEQAYAGFEKGVVPYPAGRALAEDITDLIPIFSEERDARGLLALGNWFYGQRSYDEAFDSYDHAVEADSSYAEAWSNRGAALAEQGHLSEAIDSLDRAIEADSSLVQAWSNRGNVLMEQGHLSDAIENYNQAIEAVPSEALPWYNRGVALMEQGNLSEAIKSYERAVEADPSLAQAWSNRGLALKKQGNLTDALQSYDRAIEANPSYAQAWCNRGVVLAKQDNSSDAIDSYDKAVEAEPSHAEAWTNRGNALMEQGSLTDALQSYDRAVEADPSHAEAWYNRGNALKKQGRLSEAIENYDRAVEADPSLAQAWHNRGIVLAEQGNFPDAVESYDQAVEVAPDHAEAFYNRGVALMEQGKLSDAIESYDRAIEIDPSHAQAWSNRGFVLQKQGNLVDAIDNYDQAVDFEPTYAQAWCNRGAALQQQGNLPKALNSYERAIEADPSHAETWSNRGNVLAKQGNFSSALDSLNQAIDIDPSLADAWHDRGIVLYEMDDGEENRDAAAQSFDRACELNPSYCGPYPWEEGNGS